MTARWNAATGRIETQITFEDGRKGTLEAEPEGFWFPATDS